MRRLGRTGHKDSNHREIVAALEAVGATVLDLSGVGYGCPDALVGYQGQDYPMEFKRPGGKLTEREEKFTDRWRGRPVSIVESVEDALDVIGVQSRRRDAE